MNGLCVACMTPTDTALGVRGEPEWHIAFLTALGIPLDQAEKTFEVMERTAPGIMSNDGSVYEWGVQVCTACAEKSRAPLPIPVLALPGRDLPVVGQPGTEFPSD